MMTYNTIKLTKPVLDIRAKKVILQAFGPDCMDIIYLKKAIVSTPGTGYTVGQKIETNSYESIDAAINSGAQLLVGAEAIEWLHQTQCPERSLGEYIITELSKDTLDCAVRAALDNLVKRNERLNNVVGMAAPPVIIYAYRRFLQYAVDMVVDNGAGICAMYDSYGVICNSASAKVKYVTLDGELDMEAAKQALAQTRTDCEAFVEKLVSIATPFVSAFIAENYATIGEYKSQIVRNVVPPIASKIWENTEEPHEALYFLKHALEKNTAAYVTKRLIPENRRANLLVALFGTNDAS